MPKNILIADDEKQFTAAFKRMLERTGHRVEEVNTGSAALRRMMTGDFDILFLDHLMPDMKGDLVCMEIRSVDRLKNVPIIIITAYHGFDEKAFIDMGATEVHYKPIEVETLVDIARRYLD